MSKSNIFTEYLFYYKIVQTNIEIQLIIINCGIIYTINPDFSKLSGDFGGDFGDFSSDFGNSGDFSKSSDRVTVWVG